MRTRHLTSSACALLLAAGLAGCGLFDATPAADSASEQPPPPSAPAQLSASERAALMAMLAKLTAAAENYA